MDFFDSFERIRIINLAHRTDRRREMENELAGVGLLGDPKVKFFSAHSFVDKGLFYSAGAVGAFSSHLAILSEALEANQSVLILEDDCDFTRHVRNFALPARWDIFYGGYEATSNPDDPTVSDIVGAHCMGFSAATLPALVSFLIASFEGPDPAPIDGEYVRFRRANPSVVAVFATPPLGVQRPSRTDIGPQMAYEHFLGLKEAIAWARKVKRCLTRL